MFQLHCSNADLASRSRSHAVADTLESSHLWIGEHVALVERSHPEGDGVGKELASSLGHALNVWTGSEVFQTRTSADKVLSAAALTGRSMSKERVAHPHTVVAVWTGWDIVGLRVDSKDTARSLAHAAPRNVWHDIVAHKSHGRDRQVGSQPVRLAISTGVSAHIAISAVSVWHGAESSNARAGGSEVLGLVLHVTGGV